MKTTPFTNVLFSQQIILDYRSNVLLNIYKINNKFAFRYLQSKKQSLDVKDPITDSNNFNWGYGLFSSPEEAIEEAREYYLTHGVFKVLEENI